jgi:hypothetical protein
VSTFSQITGFDDQDQSKPRKRANLKARALAAERGKLSVIGDHPGALAWDSASWHPDNEKRRDHFPDPAAIVLSRKKERRNRPRPSCKRAFPKSILRFSGKNARQNEKRDPSALSQSGKRRFSERFRFSESGRSLDCGVYRAFLRKNDFHSCGRALERVAAKVDPGFASQPA